MKYLKITVAYVSSIWTYNKFILIMSVLALVWMFIAISINVWAAVSMFIAILLASVSKVQQDLLNLNEEFISILKERFDKIN